MAARDSASNPTGTYRKPIFDKKIYDPRKITGEQYLTWGRQAAAKAQSHGPLSREWTGVTPDGIKFMGYLDETGAVKSFFPEY